MDKYIQTLIRKILLVTISGILISCTPERKFEDISCSPSEVSYRVFKPCREMIYSAKYWDVEYNLISKEKIWMMATGRPWNGNPERQNEIHIVYEYRENMINALEKYSLNLEASDWTNQEVTGVIENENEVWMHPFRQNQYNFTEVAPFPKVNLPIRTGSTWESKLTINDWGVWSNSTVASFYEVVDYNEIDLEIGKLNVWEIHSIGKAPYGNSTHNFWFHPELGFVKMVIHNYAGQTLEFELIEVIND